MTVNTITHINSDWKLTLTREGNLAAAHSAVEKRIGKGLATPEALKVARESVPPVSLKGMSIPATVPGDVHQDLIRAGIVKNPHHGLNEFETQWIGRCEWEYSTTFHVEMKHELNEIVFEGVDTVSAVYLNDVKILDTRDMHVTYCVEVSDILVLGENKLQVLFVAQEDWADEQENLLGRYPNAYSDPTNQIRKMACNYGWDWGPTLVTAGIWKQVYLRQFDVRFDAPRIIPHVEKGQAKLLIGGRVVGASANLELRVWQDLELIGSRAIDTNFEFVLDVNEVELWYPRGYGEQRLYDIRVELVNSSGVVVDVVDKTVGYRSAEIVSESDEFGTNFEIRVNGKRIWVRGANWIPNNTSIAIVDSESYEKSISDALDANMNLLRVWGGGIFEKDEFYEICDRLGILVWQDFLFACASYPEDNDNSELIMAEARDAIPRLSSHPALVVWNGSNENIWGYFDWGWQEDLGDRKWGLGYYTDLIPALLAELDPTRPYQPSSPWSGTMNIHPNDPNHGTAHLWEPWNRQDYVTYLDSVPRFVTEYGYQSPAAYSTLASAVGDDELWEDSVGMRAHQKALDGKKKLRRGIDLRFPNPENFNDWHYLTQLEQARALALGINHLRSNHSISSGSVIWQLNDCWPANSWAIVDVYGHRKPAWHAVRKCYEDRILAFKYSDSHQWISVVNDSQVTWNGVLTISRFDMSGEEQATLSYQVQVPPNSASDFDYSHLMRGNVDLSTELLVAQMDSKRAFKFLAEDKEIHYPKPEYSVEVSRMTEGLSLTIHAGTLLRDVCLFVDRIEPDSMVNDSFFSLLPGEVKVVEVTTKSPEKFADCSWDLVLRSAGEFRS